MNTTKYEVEIKLEAADTEVLIERHGPNDWHFYVKGLIFIQGEEELVGKEFVLTDEQAAATLALFIGDDAIKNEELVKYLYSIAEQVWSNVEQCFRIIP